MYEIKNLNTIVLGRMVTFQKGIEWDWVEQTKDFNYLEIIIYSSSCVVNKSVGVLFLLLSA